MELYAGSDLHSRNDLTVKELEEWLHSYETIRGSPLGNHQVYFALKNLVLPRDAGSSMGHACSALRGSAFYGSA